MLKSRKYLIFSALALESRLTNLLLHHIPLASKWETGIFPDLFRFCPAFTCSPILNPEVFGAQSPCLGPRIVLQALISSILSSWMVYWTSEDSSKGNPGPSLAMWLTSWLSIIPWGGRKEGLAGCYFPRTKASLAQDFSPAVEYRR